MADADVTVERAIMEKYKRLSSDVLKVGHHGGKDTCSADFLKRVEPEIAVMSVNESARPQYPDIQTLARLKASGCRLLRTDTDGIITIEADVEGAMHIKTKKVSIYAEKI
jgi:competence protein ComEC